MSSNDHEKAAAAVLVQSDAMPDDAVKVKGIDLDALRKNGSISVKDLLSSYATTGFQGSSIGDAANVINNMVYYPETELIAARLAVNGIWT